MNRIYYYNNKRFYPYLIPNEDNRINLLSSQDYHPNDFLVAMDYMYPNSDKKHPLFTSFKDNLEFFNWIRTVPFSDRCFYEIINSHQKPHFDIDIDATKDDVNLSQYTLEDLGINTINSLISSIQTVMTQYNIPYQKDQHCMIYSSHREDKRSYHVVINGFYHDGPKEADAFYQLIIQNIPEHLKRYIDHSVYKRNQQFRLLGCHKLGKANIKILDPLTESNITEIDPITLWSTQDHDLRVSLLRNFEASLISFVGDCELLPSFIVEQKIKHSTKSNAIREWLASKGIVMDTKALTVINKYIDIEEYYNDVILFFEQSEFYHDFNIKETKGGILKLTRKRRSFCPIHKRYHDSDHAFIFITGQGSVYLRCCRSEKHDRSYYLGKIPGLGSNDKLTEDELNPLDTTGDYFGGFDLKMLQNGASMEEAWCGIEPETSNVNNQSTSNDNNQTFSGNNQYIRQPAAPFINNQQISSNQSAVPIVNNQYIRQPAAPFVNNQQINQPTVSINNNQAAPFINNQPTVPINNNQAAPFINNQPTVPNNQGIITINNQSLEIRQCKDADILHFVRSLQVQNSTNMVTSKELYEAFKLYCLRERLIEYPQQRGFTNILINCKDIINISDKQGRRNFIGLSLNTAKEIKRNNSLINLSNNGKNIVTTQSTVSINPYKITNNNTITNVTTASSNNTDDLLNSNNDESVVTNNSPNECIDDDITDEMLESTITNPDIKVFQPIMLRDFWDHAVFRDDDSRISTKDIYKSFESWCKCNYIATKHREKGFSKLLINDLCLSTIESNSITYITGWKLVHSITKEEHDKKEKKLRNIFTYWPERYTIGHKNGPHPVSLLTTRTWSDIKVKHEYIRQLGDNGRIKLPPIEYMTDNKERYILGLRADPGAGKTELIDPYIQRQSHLMQLEEIPEQLPLIQEMETKLQQMNETFSNSTTRIGYMAEIRELRHQIQHLLHSHPQSHQQIRAQQNAISVNQSINNVSVMNQSINTVPITLNQPINNVPVILDQSINTVPVMLNQSINNAPMMLNQNVPVILDQSINTVPVMNQSINNAPIMLNQSINNVSVMNQNVPVMIDQPVNNAAVNTELLPVILENTSYELLKKQLRMASNTSMTQEEYNEYVRLQEEYMSEMEMMYENIGSNEMIEYGETLNVPRVKRDLTVLYVVPRITLTSKIANDLRGRDFVVYSDDEVRNNGLIRNQPRLCVTYNSLHRVIGSYDLVIFDEYRMTIELQFSTILQKKLASYKALCARLKYTDKVIIMDALLENKHIMQLKHMSKREITVYQCMNQLHAGKELCVIDTDITAINCALKDIGDNRRVAIASGSAITCRYLYDRISGEANRVIYSEGD